jgi:hypothetical protein
MQRFGGFRPVPGQSGQKVKKTPSKYQQQLNNQGMAAQVCNLSYTGSISRRIVVQCPTQAKTVDHI